MATVFARYLPKPHELQIFLWYNCQKDLVKNPSMGLAYRTNTSFMPDTDANVTADSAGYKGWP